MCPHSSDHESDAMFPPLSSKILLKQNEDGVFEFVQ